METKTKQVNVRMEPTAHKAAKDRARDQGRSLGGHIAYLLRRDIQAAQREGKA